ncbi:MAG TPA: class I SAM-dependent methyltransferase [Candidatus Polarisedimenticolia bacterium]|jgi:SAM-dependent methyltransferase|nr:class I SAM-dependent methyltransferase [Candidatus Polarisedimenticolia bacterium]
MVRADPEPNPRGSDPEEHARIRRLYEATYREERYLRRWSGPGPHLIHRGKWEALRPLLASLGLPRQDALVLDLGAGGGIDCVEMDRLGWPRSGIVALDLVAPDLRAARRQLPGLPAAVADATQLPIGDARVDLVFQSTMISSVLDASRRSAIYAEGARVLKPGGAFISYDTRYPNPWNRNTRPVSAAELRGAFPGWPLRLRSVTLLPPLVRRLAPISEGLCGAFERLPFLRSHFIACAVKP